MMSNAFFIEMVRANVSAGIGKSCDYSTRTVNHVDRTVLVSFGPRRVNDEPGGKESVPAAPRLRLP